MIRSFHLLPLFETLTALMVGSRMTSYFIPLGSSLLATQILGSSYPNFITQKLSMCSRTQTFEVLELRFRFGYG